MDSAFTGLGSNERLGSDRCQLHENAMHSTGRKWASSLAATCVRWSGRIGALQPGRHGGVAAPCDPLADVACLGQVATAIKGGLTFNWPEADC